MTEAAASGAAQDSGAGDVVADIRWILRTRLWVAPLLLAVATLDARAAEPSSGTVSASSPFVSWTGEAETAPFARQMRDERFRRCAPAICDTFGLAVADTGQLAVRVKGAAKAVAVQLRLPDATTVYADNFDGDPEQPVTLVVQDAKAGEYGVEMWQDATEVEEHALSGDAALSVPVPAAAPTTPPAAAPPAAPPATQPTSRLRLHTTRAPAGRRRLRISVSATSAVRDLRVQLVRAGRVVARGRRGRLNGRATVVLRARRALRPGRYALGLSAADDSGTRIATSRRVTLTRR